MDQAAADFSFRFLPSSDPKGRTVRYEEPGHTLELFFELTGFGLPYDWVGGTEAFDVWSTPSGSPIPHTQRALIRARFTAWSQAQGFKVGFERPMTLAEHDSRLIAAGYTKTIREDGSILWTPPARAGLFNWLMGLLR